MSALRVEPDVVRMLARYFGDNPLACDTPEGALRWWLPQDMDINEDMVVKALNTLVARGALQTLPAADGRVRYRFPGGENARVALARCADIDGPGPERRRR